MCEFCWQYKYLREFYDADEAKCKERGKAVRVDFRACLVTQTHEVWRDDFIETGKVTYEAMELNYCPTCGTPLKEQFKA